MKFLKNIFRDLSILFAIYIFFILVLSFYEDSHVFIPDVIEEFIFITLLIITLPFDPILRRLGFLVQGGFSFPTTEGVILSLAIWELVLISLYVFFKKRLLKK